MFVECGLCVIIVCDIVDGVGILFGSLYYYFVFKEEMVDELLCGFFDWFFVCYCDIVDSMVNLLEWLQGLFMVLFEVIEYYYV